MIKKLCMISLATVMAFSLGACSSANSGGATGGADVSEESVEVSKAEFTTALESFKISVDKFKGDYEVWPNNLEAAGFTDKTDGFHTGMFSVDFTRASDSTEWQFLVLTNYTGEGWMFHDEVDLKSDSGSLVLNVSGADRNDQVGDGGSVSETGVTKLTGAEIQQLCKVVSASPVMLRMSGTRGEYSSIETDSLPNAGILKQACVVWSGLSQGFSIDQ